MGNFCCLQRSKRKNIVLILLGLDNAGKTVAARNLAGKPVDQSVPTVGFSVVNLKYSIYDIKVYDLGGRTDFRDIWERYYVDAHGVIFVVDSSDYDRLNEAQEVLSNIISHEKIRGKPLLLLANKQNNENALDEIDLIEKLDLESLVNTFECPTLIESCSANELNQKTKLDPGIKKGYNWIINYVIREYLTLNERVQIDMEYQEEIDIRERQEKMERLKYLNELEAKRNEIEQAPTSKATNGLPVNDVYIITNNHMKHSDSDSSQSSDSLPHVYYGTIQCEVAPDERPKSATNIVRQQLELENLNRKSSFKFPTNKTTPVHFYGMKSPRQPKSASERKNTTKLQDRRVLKSAGDSIFVVSNSRQFTLPVNNGSGDLRIFEMVNSNGSKNVLPPIDINNKLKLQNGMHETNFDV